MTVPSDLIENARDDRFHPGWCPFRAALLAADDREREYRDALSHVLHLWMPVSEAGEAVAARARALLVAPRDTDAQNTEAE